MVATFSGSVTVNALPPPPGDGLSVVITRGDTGASITYTQSESTNLGSYVDPEGGWTQQCFLAPIKSEFPGLRIFFRPDATSSRQEVIFEYGEPMTTPAQPGSNSPPYVARIYDGTDLLYTSPNIPIHYWLTRWRWNPTPRLIRKTGAQVIATGIIPNYAIPSTVSSVTNTPAAQTYSIMGTAGMRVGMDQTSDRLDIGMITDWCAHWVCRGTLANTILAQAEAIGHADIIIRDPTTHSPLEVITAWPRATLTNQVFATSVPHIPLAPGGIYVFHWDSGHHPSPCVVPFLATGDVYYLEHMQFAAIRSIINVQYTSRFGGAGRYVAWPMRDSLYAEQCTPESIPGWLLPKSAFAAHTAIRKADVDAEMAETSVDQAVFRYNAGGSQNQIPGFPAGTYAAPWQESMRTAVMALAVQHGKSEWLPLLTWKADSEITRLSGTVYHRATPNPYNTVLYYTTQTTAAITATDTAIPVNPSYGKAPWPATPFIAKLGNGTEYVQVTNRTDSLFTVIRGVSGTPRATGELANVTIRSQEFIPSWAALDARLRACYALENAFDASDATGNAVLLHWGPSNPTGKVGNPDYLGMMHGAMGMAASVGVTGAEAAYDWLHGQLETWKRDQPQWCVLTKWDIKKTAP